MEVRKLYYEDCHLKTFTATVRSCTQTAKGWEITLDATAFYPEGGGQPCDLGVLGDAKVLDVKERGEQVIHLCDRPMEEGRPVTGAIDWQRRFDLMQQHSGEHILSGLIYAKYGYHNVGFHVGKTAMEVDFDGPIPPEELAQLELQANMAVWQDLPITSWYPSEEELPTVPYRRKKELAWPVRIVQVPGHDACACCGVHVAHTGEIGLIKILNCTKFHEGVRLEMLCGRRAYDYMCRIYEQNRQVSQTFSAQMLQTGEAARKFADQLAAEKFRAAGLEKRVFASIAAGYAGRGAVLHFEEGLSSAGVRELADAIAQACGGRAAVFSGSDEAGYSMCLVHHGGDVKELGTCLAKELNGRGGGKPGFFQGSVKAMRSQIETFFK